MRKKKKNSKEKKLFEIRKKLSGLSSKRKVKKKKFKEKTVRTEYMRKDKKDKWENKKIFQSQLTQKCESVHAGSHNSRIFPFLLIEARQIRTQ